MLWLPTLVLVSFVLIEVTLRLQQRMGPVVDLAPEKNLVAQLSDVINHRPRLGAHVGEVAGRKFIREYDKLGVRINRRRKEIDNPAVRILFLGDSFMEGYDDANTIPQYLWENWRKRGLNATVFNAGYTSYSPLIYIVQAKNLVPALRPDMVIVEIDETDLGDDYVRYRKLVTRDSEGKVVAVKATPVNREFLAGLDALNSETLYSVRFIRKIYLTRFLIPRKTREYRKRDPRHVLSFSWDTEPDARRRYAKEIAFFENNVAELMETLVGLLGDTRRVIVVHHPHLQHLQARNDGRFWNTFVAEVLRKVTTRYGVQFHDATADLRGNFGESPERYYLPGDMHFNVNGLRAYAASIDAAVWPEIARLAEQHGVVLN